MPNLKPKFSYEIANTYVTDSGEHRVEVDFYHTDSSDEKNNISKLNLGFGNQQPNNSLIEGLLAASLPQYFE
jgi:hypothetical protein